MKNLKKYIACILSITLLMISYYSVGADVSEITSSSLSGPISAEIAPQDVLDLLTPSAQTQLKDLIYNADEIRISDINVTRTLSQTNNTAPLQYKAITFTKKLSSVERQTDYTIIQTYNSNHSISDGKYDVTATATLYWTYYQTAEQNDMYETTSISGSVYDIGADSVSPKKFTVRVQITDTWEINVFYEQSLVVSNPVNNQIYSQSAHSGIYYAGTDTCILQANLVLSNGDVIDWFWRLQEKS